MELQLEIAGILLIGLALLHAGFPRYFNWREALRGLDDLHREVFKVHTFFVALMVLLMGILCLTSASELSSTPLGRKIAWGLFSFWFARLIIQFCGYSSKLWRGKPFETSMHLLFSLLWAYLSAVFLLTAIA
ncbi:hypothetical protein [Haloferula sp.]|uniref:hypothetical protein n=1 Tax=Haloferula sp. TaxID=2497595 RepID=UPI003C77B0FF